MLSNTTATLSLPHRWLGKWVNLLHITLSGEVSVAPVEPKNPPYTNSKKYVPKKRLSSRIPGVDWLKGVKLHCYAFAGC